MKFLFIVLTLFSVSTKAQLITLQTSTISGVVDYAGATIRVDGYINGNCTIKNAHVVPYSKYAHIFDTTVNFENCTFESDFSTAWYGAKTSRPDNYRFLKKAIDTYIDNRLPALYCAATYTYSEQLKFEKIVNGVFVAVNVNFYGDGSLHNQRQTLIYTGTGIALSVQLAKGGSFKGLWIKGSYQPPVGSMNAEYCNTAWPVTSGHYGIVIDYDGSRNTGGSTDFKVIETNVSNFDVAYSVSPNAVTFNADILLFDRIRAHDSRIGFQSNQAQEKGNVIRYIESWGKLHTLIQIGNSGKFQAGQYVIEDGNIAGECVQLFDITLGGWNNFHVKHLYAESIARIGNINAWTSSTRMPAHLTVDVRLASKILVGNQIIFTCNNNRVTFRNSTIWYYGESGQLIAMNGAMYFDVCDFGSSKVSGSGPLFTDHDPSSGLVLPKTFVGKPYSQQ